MISRIQNIVKTEKQPALLRGPLITLSSDARIVFHPLLFYTLSVLLSDNVRNFIFVMKNSTF